MVALLVATRSRATEPSHSPDAAVAVGAEILRLAPDAPRKPPAQICGSAGLKGPSTPPAGARVIRTSTNLSNAVLNAPPGKTFWLEPGVHYAGDDEFAQLIPKDGQSFIGAPGAILDGQRINRYAFTQQATGVTIAYLTIRNFTSPGDEGVVNHDAGAGWRIVHNTVRNNKGAGVFLGTDTVVAHNCLIRNGQYGFSAPGDSERVVLRHNEIAYNDADAWDKLQPGCGCSGGGKFWKTTGAKVLNNYVHHNKGPGLWADTNNTGFLISGNYVDRNEGEGLIYETSYNASIVNNTFSRNAWKSGLDDGGFPIPAIYVSESGSDPRAGASYGETLDIIGNRFIDNWSGVVGWENADRFAGSPNNSSTGETTLVNPNVATVEACADPDLIGTSPYFDDCRWKVQHLRVRGNLFKIRPDRIPNCTRDSNCGFNGLFANYGSDPDWSPYQAWVVTDNITFEQDNVWSRNRYVGPWRFQIYQLGDVVSWNTWRSSKYGQDAGSTRR